jgi:hypothetical protein
MCWLCTHQGEVISKQMQQFIVKNIGFMDMQCIAQQVSDYILLKQPEAEGAEKQFVLGHISEHVLHPRVRMAVMLRQLLDFAALLQSNIVVHQGGVCTVEKSNAELYLKVISQIMTLYKADTAGMLFAEGEEPS